MRMRRSTLFICIVLVLALAGGITALMLWPEPEIEEEERPTPPPSNLATLINEPRDDVTGVHFTPRDGVPFTLQRDPEEGTIELIAEDAIFPGDSEIMRGVHGTAHALQNLTLVIEEADDEQLSRFGFDDPIMTWRVDLVDSPSIELMVGEMPATGHGRYVRRTDSREVFLLSSWQATQMTRLLEEMYDITFMPLYIDIEEDITYIFLETDDGIIELQRREFEEIMELGLGASLYQMLQPAVSEVNDMIVQTVILGNAAMIFPESVETVRPADLSVYGLDNPARLTLHAHTEELEWSATLLIGDRDAQRGGRFVMIEGYDAVLFDSSGDYSFLFIDPTQLRSRLIWLHSIENIASVTFELDGETRILEFEHFTDDNDRAVLRGWLDGEPISETNARRLYIGALSVTQDGDTDAPIPNTPPVYSITKHYLDGSSDTMELYRLNDAQFLLVLNGESLNLFITRLRLQLNLLSRFERLDRGEDIPA